MPSETGSNSWRVQSGFGRVQNLVGKSNLPAVTISAEFRHGK